MRAHATSSDPSRPHRGVAAAIGAAGIAVIAAAAGAAGAGVLATSSAPSPKHSAHAAASIVHQGAEPSDLFDQTVVRDFRLTFDDAGWEDRLRRLDEDEYLLADLVVDGEEYPDVGLRIKGNSSARGSERKVPLSLKMDAEVPGQDLLGYDTLNLNNGFVNPTFTREVLTLTRLRAAQPMPRSAHARVYANGAFFGLYTLVEQIEGTFVRAWFGSADGTLIKADAPAGGGVPGGFRSELSWLGEDLAAYRAAYEIKRSADEEAALRDLRELTRVLDAPASEGGLDDAGFAAAIRAELAVDRALWYIASVNLFTNYDSYYAGHNYYLYRPDAEGRFHVLSWDVNESFGVFPGAGISPADSYAVSQTDPFLMADGASAARRPLIRRLLRVPEFRADYLAHYGTLLRETFEPDALEADIAGYQALIGDAVRADPNRLYSLDDFVRGVWEDLRIGAGPGPGSGGGRAVPGMMKVAGARHAWLLAREDMRPPDHALVEHTRMPDAPTSLDDVVVTARFEGADHVGSAELVAQIDGGPPLRREMREGAGAWSAEIPKSERGATVVYYVRVAFGDGRSEFHPALNQTQPWNYEVIGAELPLEPGGPLVVNEFMALNETIIADPSGEFDDWVELYNRGDEPLDLSGYFLSDKADDPTAFALPSIVLPPGGHAIIWCDGDSDQGPDHAPFGLSKDGESVVLSTADSTVDRIDFGLQLADVSMARLLDGGPDWVACTSPSPGAANGCAGAATSTPTSSPSASDTPTPIGTVSTTPVPTPTAPATAGPTSAKVLLPFALSGGGG